MARNAAPLARKQRLPLDGGLRDRAGIASKGMVTQPADRQTAAGAMFTSMGLKLDSLCDLPGTSGIAGIIEGTMEQADAAGMARCASGGFDSFESTWLPA